MSFLVPYDATELADAALDRAASLGAVTDTAVVAVTVIPGGDREFAQEHGLLSADEPYDYGTVVERLRERVDRIAPEASFEHESIGRYAPAGQIATHLKRRARLEDVSVVFVGSENAGRYVSSLTSVGQSIAAGTAYDVYIVRTAEPTDLSGIDERTGRE